MCRIAWDFDKRDKLALILIFLVSIPIISVNYLAKFSAKYMHNVSDGIIQENLRNISEFRTRQCKSLLVIFLLFIVSLFLAHFFSILNLRQVSWLTVISTALIAHAAFDQLAWKLTWSQNSLLDVMNKWYFRITYSIGIILLFLAILK